MNTPRDKLRLSVTTENLKLKTPFRIAGYVFDSAPALVAAAERGGARGLGEAAGVYYLDDTPDSAAIALRELARTIERGVSREDLRGLLPPGGARNALDCALWDLESREAGQPVWKLAGLSAPRPLTTTQTLGADAPDVVGAGAAAASGATALKLKLTGEAEEDAARVRAARRARPDVWLGVDANQGYAPETLEALVPVLVECRVSLLEQPFKRGREADMEGVRLPVPTAADESFQSLAELEPLAGRFDVINIKLDKCGGLTEALMIAGQARRMGLGVMVGCMVGTTLSSAPAFVLGQLCAIVDLDGPTFLVADRAPASVYEAGTVSVPPEAWGGGLSFKGF